VLSTNGNRKVENAGYQKQTPAGGDRQGEATWLMNGLQRSARWLVRGVAYLHRNHGCAEAQ
jgi:hypothetical protein